jgi:hypothetical protein
VGWGVHVFPIAERRRLPRGGRVVQRLTPASRGRMADFIGGLGVEHLPAALAEAIVPAVPALEALLTAQTGVGPA